MNKTELMDLMQFVIDSNAQALAEVTTALDDQQRRTVLNAVEAKTKDCFFRVIERQQTTKKTTRKKK